MIKAKVIGKRLSAKKVTAKLKRAARLTKNTAKINREVSIWLQRWVDKNFKSEGGLVGGWKPLKAGGRWGAVRNGWQYWDANAKVLQDTGRLKASFVNFYGRNFAGIGSNLPYSEPHELGVPANNLPMRRMLPKDTDATVNAAIIKIYDRHIKKVLVK